MPPGVRFFHAGGPGVIADQTGQHLFRLIPADVIQRLKSLVGEVRRMAGVDIAVIGDGGEEHVGHLLVVCAGAHRRDDAAFGPFGIAHLDELAEPALERGEIGAAVFRQRADQEARRLTVGIARDSGQTVIEGARAIFGVQVGQQIHA